MKETFCSVWSECLIFSESTHCAKSAGWNTTTIIWLLVGMSNTHTLHWYFCLLFVESLNTAFLKHEQSSTVILVEISISFCDSKSLSQSSFELETRRMCPRTNLKQPEQDLFFAWQIGGAISSPIPKSTRKCNTLT